MLIKDQKLIYHLTDINNLENIVREGLLSRKELVNRGMLFEDVADPQILEFREAHNLDSYIPFHFFARNPFDGDVQIRHPENEFIYLCLKRSEAEAMGFQIIPTHPLNMNPFEIYSYEDGMEKIDWAVMERRDYKDHDCKEVCMAECVYQGELKITDFVSVHVKTAEAKKYVDRLFKSYNISYPFVNLTPYFFIRN